MADKILVVDSVMATRRAAMAALLPAGYELSIAETAFEAMSVARRVVPDLVVLGSSLSDAAGLQLVGRLFSTSETAEVPVIVIADTPEAQRAAEMSGARVVLSGPLDPHALILAVAEHVHAPAALAKAPASVLSDPDRLAAVAAVRPDASGEPSLDRFTNLAAKLLDAPVSVVTLLNQADQDVVSHFGREEQGGTVNGMPLSESLCQFAVTSRQPLRIDDSRSHPLSSSNTALADAHIQSYLGIPLIIGGTQAVGALCVTDTVPRAWTDRETDVLSDLAGILADQMDTTVRQGRHALA